MKKTLLILILLVSFAAVLSACSSEEADRDRSGADHRTRDRSGADHRTRGGSPANNSSCRGGSPANNSSCRAGHHNDVRQ